MPSPSSWFGHSVALDGDWAVVGAIYDSGPVGNGTGAAYVFMREDGQWTEIQKLSPLDASEGCRFGYSVAIEGDIIVVTACPFDFGRACVFERDGASWVRTGTLLPDTSSEVYGSAVDVRAGRIAVSCCTATGPDKGAVELFVKERGGWMREARIDAPANALNIGQDLALGPRKLFVDVNQFLVPPPAGGAVLCYSLLGTETQGGELRLLGLMPPAWAPRFGLVEQLRSD